MPRWFSSFDSLTVGTFFCKHIFVKINQMIFFSPCTPCPFFNVPVKGVCYLGSICLLLRTELAFRIGNTQFGTWISASCKYILCMGKSFTKWEAGNCLSYWLMLTHSRCLGIFSSLNLPEQLRCTNSSFPMFVAGIITFCGPMWGGLCWIKKYLSFQRLLIFGDVAIDFLWEVGLIGSWPEEFL